MSIPAYALPPAPDQDLLILADLRLLRSTIERARREITETPRVVRPRPLAGPSDQHRRRIIEHLHRSHGRPLSRGELSRMTTSDLTAFHAAYICGWQPRSSHIQPPLVAEVR